MNESSRCRTGGGLRRPCDGMAAVSCYVHRVDPEPRGKSRGWRQPRNGNGQDSVPELCRDPGHVHTVRQPKFPPESSPPTANRRGLDANVLRTLDSQRDLLFPRACEFENEAITIELRRTYRVSRRCPLPWLLRSV